MFFIDSFSFIHRADLIKVTDGVQTQRCVSILPVKVT